MLPDASDASNASDAARGAGFGGHAGRVDERRGGLPLVAPLTSL